MKGFDPIEKNSDRMLVIMIAVLIILIFFKHQLNSVTKGIILVVAPISIILCIYFTVKEKRNEKIRLMNTKIKLSSLHTAYIVFGSLLPVSLFAYTFRGYFPYLGIVCPYILLFSLGFCISSYAWLKAIASSK
jgi:Ca2+/Na+ antiporter